MSARSYTRVPGPVAATVGAGPPVTFYARLVAEAFRVRRPARGRLAPIWSFLADRQLPEGLLADLVRRLPRRPRPELDALLGRLEGEWEELARRSARLPRRPPPLTALALRRPVGEIVFAFGDAPTPLLVAKVPGDDPGRLADEAVALEAAAPARMAPRFLGRTSGTFVQEALSGSPLRVRALAPAGAGELAWPAPLADLAAAFSRLAAATARREPPADFDPHLERALEEPSLSPGARRTLAAARRDLGGVGVSVLRHRDVTVENCLFRDGRLDGVIDWEWASRGGAPGFDVWSAALLHLEAAVGLARWSPERLVETFRSAWPGAPFFREARVAGRAAARAAGVGEGQLDALEVAYFAGRLGRRLGRRHAWATDAWAAARMLEIVSQA